MIRGMKTLRNPDTIHPPAGLYTHQIELSGDERLLLMAGQVGMRADGSVAEEPIEQLRLALENVRRNLVAAGMDVTDLVKMTIYLVDELANDERRRVTAAMLGDHRPCSTVVYVARLATPELKVEVDAWASRSRE